MTVNGTVDSDVMETFARDFLAPKLRCDDVVILDDFKPHGVSRFLQHIERRGAKVVSVPPYSPDLNPIEMMWSKLKAIIRKEAPRTTRAFSDALKRALSKITHSDLRAWFCH